MGEMSDRVNLNVNENGGGEEHAEHHLATTEKLVALMKRGLGTGTFHVKAMHQNILKPVAAEFIASAMFMIWGCGSVISFKKTYEPKPDSFNQTYCGPDLIPSAVANAGFDNYWPSSADPCYINGKASCLEGVDVMAIAFAFGFSIIVLAYTFCKISGAHINPAVTLCTILTGDMPVVLGLFYMAGQCTGAVIGGYTLMSIYPQCEGDMVAWGTTGVNYSRGFSVGQGLMCEIILTFALCMTVLYTAVSKDGMGNLAPLAIGMCVLVDHIVGVEITGASMNPARSLGSAFVSTNFKDFWIYVLGPAVGACLATAIYRFLLTPAKVDH